MGRLGKAVAVAGTAVASAAVAIGVESVRAATEFQASMEKIHTQAGATQKDVQKLTGQVLKMAPATQQGPQALSEALFHLKSLGMQNVAAMKALRQASDLAAVGGANLEETATAIGAAWRSGIKGGQSFSKVAGTVNAVIGAGNLKMEDLILALGTGILPSARTFGVSLKSVGAALALMTDEGIPAQNAATRLRMSLSLLGAPSDKAAGDLETIGLKSDTLAKAMRSPGGIVAAIQILKKHLDDSGLSATHQAQLLSNAFGGGRSSSAILTMINNLGVLEQKQKQINATTGRYGQAVIDQRKTASAQFALLRSTVETVGIRIGVALLPPVTKFVKWINARAIPAVSKFTHWLTSPDVKPWAEVAGKIAAGAGAAALIYKSFHKVLEMTGLKGVLSLGKTVAGRAGTGAAGANMSSAAKMMLDASLNMLKAAGIEADVAGTGAGAAGKGGLGTAGAAAAGAAASRGGVIAGARSFLGTAAIAALITEIVVKPILQGFPQDKKAGTSFWDRPSGSGPKGSSGWESWHQLGANIVHAGAAVVQFGLAARGVVKPVNDARKAFTPVPSHFAPGPGITVGPPKVPSHFAPHSGSGTITPTAAEKADLKWLERLYGISLPKAEKLASASGSALGTKWDSQSKSAANARTRLAALNAAYMLMHGGQKRATADAEAYTTALKLNGSASAQTISARRQYIRDLENAHVPAQEAVRLAAQLATGINNLGHNLAATHPTRHQLAADLTASGLSAKTARGLVDRYADAVKTDGANSDRASAARRRLINDLEKSGLSAKAAAKLVDGLQTRISSLKGKTVNVGVHGSGSGNITFAQQVLGQKKSGFLEFHSRGALIPGYGGGDKHLAMLEGGETVVPKHLTPLVAPLMKAHRIPGFSSGALVGKASVLGRGVPYAVSTEASFARQTEQQFAQAAVRATKSALNQAAKALAGSMGDSGARTHSAAVAQAYARSILSQYGWGASQMASLIPLWNQESGWNAYAVNPSSGAYGIPQSLGHGHPYNLGDYVNQIIWGLDYIRGRYGSPAGAWAHERAFNWYGKGLANGIFRRPTLIGVGEDGPERVSVEPLNRPAAQDRRSGPLIHADQLVVNNGTDLALLGQKLNFAVISSGFRM